MAFLRMIKGDSPGKLHEIVGECVVFGRHPNCNIVLEGAGVSRHHAQILESHGRYYIEDMRSRNGTFVNDREIENRTRLADRDVITLCDYSFHFHVSLPEDATPPSKTVTLREGEHGEPPTSPIGTDADQPADVGAARPGQTIQDDSEGTSIISTVNVESSSRMRLNVNPEGKLKAVLQISRVLGRTLDLDQVLSKILEALFSIFLQADEGFVLLRDPETRKLRIRASRVRHANQEDALRISTTIVNKALESGEGILSANASEDSRFSMSESIDGLRIKSMICAPLLGIASEGLGVIQIATWDLRQQFSEDDLDLLISVASQACLTIENAYLHQTALLQRDLDRELEFAMQVQLGFLPKKRPKPGGYRFHDYYEAAQRVGGDFFDYITLSDGRIAIALADVAGKGVPAALLMARLYSSARFHILTNPTVGGAVAGLNRELATSGLGHRFVTFLLAVIDPESHELTIANAGHLPPLRRTAQRTVETLSKNVSGMPLGIAPDQPFREAKLRVEPGDTFVFYTDGVTEAMNPRRDIYSPRRLREYLASGPENVTDLVEGIVADVVGFCEGRAQSDDICMVGFTRTE